MILITGHQKHDGEFAQLSDSRKENDCDCIQSCHDYKMVRVFGVILTNLAWLASFFAQHGLVSVNRVGETARDAVSLRSMCACEVPCCVGP